MDCFDQGIEEMDSNTQILKELVEAVEKLNQPDWGMIVLTFINIVAFVFVAITQIRLQRQQTKLQEQQNKQQEYEVYRSLFVIIEKINRQAEVLPTRIYEYFAIPTYNSIFPNGFWNYTYKEINILGGELNDKLADFELKFGCDEVDADDYRQLVCEMRMVVQFVERLEANKQMTCIEQQGKHPAVSAAMGDYSPLVEAIVERTTYEPYKDAVRDNFLSFINYRQSVLDKKVLDKIKNTVK